MDDARWMKRGRWCRCGCRGVGFYVEILYFIVDDAVLMLMMQEWNMQESIVQGR
jgi:hypothetical protein